MATNPYQIVSRDGTPYRFRPGVQTDPVDPFAEDSRDPDAGFAPVGSAGTNQPGTWVPGSFANPGGLSPWKVIGLMSGVPGPTGLLSFASLMHPEGKLGTGLRYGAMASGIADIAGGLYSGFGGAPGRASLPQVQSGLPSYLQPTAGTTAAFGWPAAGNVASNVAAGSGGGGMSGFTDFLGGLGKKNMLGDRVSIMDLIDFGGDIASKWSAGRQNDRVNQAGFNMLYDQAELERYKAALLALQADINQREYTDTRYDTDTDRRLRGSMLQNIQDPTIARPEGVPTVNVSGGLRPSMFTNRADVGRDLERQATIDMLNPPKLPGIPTPPPASRVDEPGGADKALDILSLIGGGAGLFNDLLGDKPATTPGQVTKKGTSATTPTYDPNALSRPSTWNTGLGPLTLTPGATTSGATRARTEMDFDPDSADLANLPSVDAEPPAPRPIGSGSTPSAAASRTTSSSSSSGTSRSPSPVRSQSYINEPSPTALSAIYGDGYRTSPFSPAASLAPTSSPSIESLPPMRPMASHGPSMPTVPSMGPMASHGGPSAFTPTLTMPGTSPEHILAAINQYRRQPSGATPPRSMGLPPSILDLVNLLQRGR